MPPDESLRCPQHFSIESRQPPSKPVDEVVQFVVGDSPVDPPVAFGRDRVVVVAADDDLERTGAAHQRGKAFDRASPGKDPDADLRLTEDGVLDAREPQVAGESELASSAAHSTAYRRD